MAHCITDTDWMFSGNRQEPWHGIGTVVDGMLTARDAIAAARLDWTVGKVGIYTADGVQVPRFVATQRSDTKEILGVVGEDWTAVQNFEAFDFFDNVVGAGQAIYDTAGSLKGGRRVWVLAKLPDPMILTAPGGAVDVTERYLLLVNGHDGGQSLRMFFTPVRVVCNNTLTAALAGSGIDGVRFNHTQFIGRRVEEAQTALGFAVDYYKRLEQHAQVLTNKQINDAELTWFINQVFPAPAETAAKATITRQAGREQAIRDLMDSETARPFQGTAWAAVNAAVEYLDWGRPYRMGGDDVAQADRQFERAMFDLAPKRRAFEAGTALALNQVSAGIQSPVI